VGLKCLADCWTERRRSSLWRGGATRKLGEPCFQEFAQLRGKLELRNEIQFLERRGESVRETPDRPRSELPYFGSIQPKVSCHRLAGVVKKSDRQSSRLTNVAS